ncbi:DUF742 domain-containing protein [Nonomuraea cavernae]|uniref:DUF742 domain-containing protein n=1 Tax=Nonomuraea cavernae TaxID=2045107 RepID=A0A918DQ12_9ACTN|nr:DUF742 domain-containing protein [Nonomuraea cavernae]MCA2186351.1 DUF742 domain-containing protein [Nonomuraea cavernae]GGO79391.1 hypothetical protein GCM10012289_63580 [Nonomuraea cavernae]
MTEPAQWLDEDAGPIVRPYALIRGRTRSSGEMLDLIATVSAIGDPPDGLGPEQQLILRVACEPITVADLAVELDLPIGVVRVLLGDLLDGGLISVKSPSAARPRANEGILKEVINGLRAL